MTILEVRTPRVPARVRCRGRWRLYWLWAVWRLEFFRSPRVRRTNRSRTGCVRGYMPVFRLSRLPVALVSSWCTKRLRVRVRARPRNVKLYYESVAKVNNYVECAVRRAARVRRTPRSAHADPRPRARAPGQKSTAENRLEKCSLAVPTSAARCGRCARPSVRRSVRSIFQIC